MSEAVTAGAAPLLRLSGITKRFGSSEVLRGVDLSIDSQEAVGLIGDNGAGKSTLVKILSGVYAASGGTVEFDGASRSFSTPLDARRAGIEMIFQDLALCDDLSAPANVFLGREPIRRVGPVGLLDRAAMRRGAAQVFSELGATISLDAPVGDMSGGQRQLVAVARALEFSPKLLLMDEPTAALSNERIHLLLDVVQRLKARGVAVLLISHRFTDILEVCDRILVLREGRISAELSPRDGAPGEVLAQMQEALSGEALSGGGPAT